MQSAVEQGERGRLKGRRAGGENVEEKKGEGRTYSTTRSVDLVITQ